MKSIDIDDSLAFELSKVAEERGITISRVIHAHALFAESIKCITDDQCKDVLRNLLTSSFANSGVYSGEMLGGGQ